MGDPFTSVVAAVSISYWQGEEAKKEAERAERRQALAERRAELIDAARRRQAADEERRQRELLPPIIGSQTPQSELGIAALEADVTQEDQTDETPSGVQIGTTKKQTGGA
jgi:hypothetical protein